MRISSSLMFSPLVSESNGLELEFSCKFSSCRYYKTFFFCGRERTNGYFSGMTITGLSEDMAQRLQQGRSLPIMEEFHTIQGEGQHTGKAAYFIRIGGCDVGCHWCDVKESWNAEVHPLVDISKVVENAAAQPSDTVVLTGGEPMMYELGPLTRTLKQNGMKVHLETSGAYRLTGRFDWICLSPKKNAPPLPEFYEMADELKVIVFNRHDLKWADDHAEKVKARCELFLQPEWSKRDEMMPIIVEKVMGDTRWKVSLQTHKYMNIP